MRLLRDASWTRRGTTLLWGARALNGITRPDRVLSTRQLLDLARAWPLELPAGGDALVVAGLEACLDVLSPEDVESWLEGTFRQTLLSFQDEYQGQAALVLWIPSGAKRIQMSSADEAYGWRVSPPAHGTLPLGRLLFSGAEVDLARVIDPDDPKQDPDGDAWIGLHIARIS